MTLPDSSRNAAPNRSAIPNDAASPATSQRTPDDTLLMCIDMQPVFIRAVVEGERVQKRCEFAIAAAVGLGLPVLFTEQVPEKLGGTAPTLRALAPNAPVYPKRTFSALADDATRDAILRDSNVEHLILTGIETSVCVYQTAIAALAQGLEVTLLSDAVSARRSDDARTCLEALARSGAHILPSETLFYALLRDVGHPFFKPYTQLVKTHG
jgi:nicotinamidase-related amidase